MKHLLLILISSLIGLTSLAQQQSYFDFNIQSKFDTDVGISVGVYYTDRHHYDESDSIIQHINSIIIDSLRQFDIFEMYSDERYAMSIIIDSIFNKEFRNIKVKIEKVILLNVKIPQEAKLLYERFIELEQSYLEVLLEIFDRKKLLEEKLVTNTTLTESEILEIEKEILVLENYKFISKLYDKKIKDLIRNNKGL